MGPFKRVVKQIRVCSPAKINLFLHITGRRSDGYHNLQTVFQLLDWGDDMIFEPRSKTGISIIGDTSELPERENLIQRAADKLKFSGNGANIFVKKRIPTGGGLGGGSSNAASTLLALNKLWELKIPLDKLLQISTSLGADVPVFTAGRSAWAEGIGDKLTPLALPHRWFVIVTPKSAVKTAEIFRDPELTRNTPPITVQAFFSGAGHNDLEPLVSSRYADVRVALDWLSSHSADVRMSGSGSSVFAAFISEKKAKQVAKCAPSTLKTLIAEGIDSRPDMLVEYNTS